MAYFQDKRIGRVDGDQVNPPDETIDGQPYQYNPQRQPIAARFMLGDGYYAIATHNTPRQFDVAAAVEELRGKVNKSSKKASNVSESSS